MSISFVFLWEFMGMGWVGYQLSIRILMYQITVLRPLWPLTLVIFSCWHYRNGCVKSCSWIVTDRLHYTPTNENAWANFFHPWFKGDSTAHPWEYFPWAVADGYSWKEGLHQIVGQFVRLSHKIWSYPQKKRRGIKSHRPDCNLPSGCKHCNHLF